MASRIVVFVSLLINTLLFIFMYKGIYIPSGKVPLIIGFFIAAIYYLVGYLFGEIKSPLMTRFFMFTISLYVSYSLSSLTYSKWKWESLISSFSMMKISLIIFIFSIFYLNIIYIRAEISYKRKRGNIRIQQEQPKNKVEKWRKKRRGEDEGVISIQLGRSTEAEEKAPPI